MTAEWKDYEGVEEQLREMGNAKHGYIFQFKDSDGGVRISAIKHSVSELRVFARSYQVLRYLICEPLPHAEMREFQARTGQPVWVRWKHNPLYEAYTSHNKAHPQGQQTSTPKWDNPALEFSFIPFTD